MLTKKQILRKVLKYKLVLTETEYNYRNRMSVVDSSRNESAAESLDSDKNKVNEININDLDQVFITDSTVTISLASEIQQVKLLLERTSNNRKVKFSHQVEVVLIPSRADLDPAIRAALWWDMTAFKSFTLCAYLQLRECMNTNECSVREALTQLYQPSAIYEFHS